MERSIKKDTAEEYKNSILFQELYNTYYNKLKGYLYKRLQNKEEAEELTQEVFYRFYRQCQKGQIDFGKSEPYLYRSAQNALYDLWRKRGRNPRIITMEPFEERGKAFSREEEKLDDLLVTELMEELSEQEERILRLRVLEGYSVKETAGIMKMPEGTIKSIQYRALKKLKEIVVGGL